MITVTGTCEDPRTTGPVGLLSWISKCSSASVVVSPMTTALMTAEVRVSPVATTGLNVSVPPGKRSLKSPSGVAWVPAFPYPFCTIAYFTVIGLGDADDNVTVAETVRVPPSPSTTDAPATEIERPGLVVQSIAWPLPQQKMSGSLYQYPTTCPRSLMSVGAVKSVANGPGRKLMSP